MQPALPSPRAILFITFFLLTLAGWPSGRVELSVPIE
jgi:hypothetical protein